MNMFDKFQQSPIFSGRCLLPFLRQSGGHSNYATETGMVVYRCSSRTRLFPCPVLCYDWLSWSRECKKLWSLHRCSSWTRFFSCLGVVPYRSLCRFHWCSSWRRRSSTSLSWCKGRSPWSRLFQQTTEISPLQYINEVIDALLWEEVLSQCHFGRGLLRTALFCYNYHSSHPLFHGLIGS